MSEYDHVSFAEHVLDFKVCALLGFAMLLSFCMGAGSLILYVNLCPLPQIHLRPSHNINNEIKQPVNAEVTIDKVISPMQVIEREKLIPQESPKIIINAPKVTKTEITNWPDFISEKPSKIDAPKAPINDPHVLPIPKE